MNRPARGGSARLSRQSQDFILGENDSPVRKEQLGPNRVALSLMRIVVPMAVDGPNPASDFDSLNGPYRTGTIVPTRFAQAFGLG